jgi:hypothetical protein
MRVQVRGPIGDGDFLHSETWVSHPFKIGVCGALSLSDFVYIG